MKNNADDSPSTNAGGSPPAGGSGKASSFAVELYAMLDGKGNFQFDDIVCWHDDGRSFCIKDPHRFETEV